MPCGATRAGNVHVPRCSTGHIEDLPQQHSDMTGPRYAPWARANAPWARANAPAGRPGAGQPCPAWRVRPPAVLRPATEPGRIPALLSGAGRDEPSPSKRVSGREGGVLARENSGVPSWKTPDARAAAPRGPPARLRRLALLPVGALIGKTEAVAASWGKEAGEGKCGSRVSGRRRRRSSAGRWRRPRARRASASVCPCPWR